MIKKIILVLLGIIVLAVGGLTVYVSMIDWNLHKNKLAEEFSDILGEKIVISGDISVSLLPHPRMTADSIVITNPNNEEKLAEIKSLETSVSLLAVLQGTVDVQSLSLNDTQIWLTIYDDGTTNWKQQGRPKFLDSVVDTRLQSFSLQNAILHFNQEKYDIHWDLVGLNADIQAGSFSGPYRIDGNFIKDDDRYGIAVSMGSINQLDDVGLAFAVVHQKTNSYIKYDGVYDFQNNNLSGEFSGSSANLADLINSLYKEDLLAAKYNSPLVFSVDARVDNQQVNLSRLVIKYDNYLEGSGDINIPLQGKGENKPQANIKYQLLNFNAQPLYEFAFSKLKKYQQGEKFAPDTEYDVLYDISAERVRISDAAGGVLENVSAKGGWIGNALDIDEVYAACPGNIVCTMKGSLIENNEAVQYYADVSADGQNFLALLQAMNLEIATPQKSAYRGLKLNLEINGNAEEAIVSVKKFDMDKMNVEGQVKIELPAEQYQVQLHANKINFDNYLPKDDQSSDFFATVKNDLYNIKKLQNSKIDLHLDADEAVFRAATIKDFLLEAAADKQSFEIKKFSAKNIINTDIEISAKLPNLSQENPEIQALKYEIISQNPEALIKKLQIPLPNMPILSVANWKAQGEMHGSIDNFTTDSNLEQGDNKLHYKGSIQRKDGQYFLDGLLNLKSTNLEKLLKDNGTRVANLSNYRSPLNAKSQILLNSDGLKLDEIEAMLGSAKYSGNLQIKSNSNRHEVKGMLTATEFNFGNLLYTIGSKTTRKQEALFKDNFMAHPDLSKDVFDFDVYRNLDMDVEIAAEKGVYDKKTAENVKLHILNSQNVMQLNDISFAYKDTQVKGNIQLSYIQEPKISGKLTVNNAQITDWKGAVYGITAENVHYDTEFSAPAFSLAEIFNKISGTLSYSTGPLTLMGIDLGAIEEDLARREQSKGLFQSVQDNLRKGYTEFSSAAGNVVMENGVLQFDKSLLKNAHIETVFSGKINLEEWKVNGEFEVKYPKLDSLPTYSFSFTGSLNKPVLDLNIEKIVKQYDELWEQVALKKQEEKDKQTKILQEKMTAAQQKVSALAEKVNKLINELENGRNKTKNAESLLQFNEEIEHLNEINRQINLMQGVERQAEYSEQQITEVEDNCRKLENQLAEHQKHVAIMSEDDLQRRVHDTLKDVKKLNEKSQILQSDYQKMIQDNYNELAKINMAQFLVNNVNLKKQQSEMADLRNAVAKQYNEFLDEYSLVSEVSDSMELEEKCARLQQKVARINSTYIDMEKLQENSSQLLLKLVNERQQAYAKEQEQKVVFGDLAPNPDNLLETENKNDEETVKQKVTINDNAQSVTILNKTDESADKTVKAEDKPALLQEAQMVGSSLKVSGVIKKSYEETAEKKPTVSSSGLLKPVEGIVQPASGKIIVK